MVLNSILIILRTFFLHFLCMAAGKPLQVFTHLQKDGIVIVKTSKAIFAIGLILMLILLCNFGAKLWTSGDPPPLENLRTQQEHIRKFRKVYEMEWYGGRARRRDGWGLNRSLRIMTKLSECNSVKKRKESKIFIRNLYRKKSK